MKNHDSTLLSIHSITIHLRDKVTADGIQEVCGGSGQESDFQRWPDTITDHTRDCPGNAACEAAKCPLRVSAPWLQSPRHGGGGPQTRQTVSTHAVVSRCGYWEVTNKSERSCSSQQQTGLKSMAMASFGLGMLTVSHLNIYCGC